MNSHSLAEILSSKNDVPLKGMVLVQLTVQTFVQVLFINALVLRYVLYRCSLSILSITIKKMCTQVLKFNDFYCFTKDNKQVALFFLTGSVWQ